MRTANTVVPPYLLSNLADNGGERFPRAADAARTGLRADARVRQLRAEGLRAAPDGSSATARTRSAQAGEATGPNRQIHDAQNKEDLVDMITSGVRSSFTYAGADSVPAFRERARVGVQSAAGYEEGKALPVSW